MRPRRPIRAFIAIFLLAAVIATAFLVGRRSWPRHDWPTTAGFPVLHAAVARDDHQEVERRLEGRSNLEFPDSNGDTLLHHARSFEMVDRLLSAGALRDARNHQKETPLATARTADAARALLSAGADPTARDETDETPLHDAHNAELVFLLADAGADLDARDRDGRAPLHAAVNGGVVEALLQTGADPHLVDSRGLSPLHLARDAEAVKALVRAGVAVSIKDTNGSVPLHTVADASAAKQLLRMGADRDALDVLGRTPFLANERAEIAEVLLDAGTDVNADSNTSVSKLARAFTYNRNDMALLLLERGADLPTPNHWSNCRSPTVLRALLKRGASPRTLRIAGVTDQELVRKLISLGALVQPKASSLGSPLGEAPTPEIARVILDAYPEPQEAGDGLKGILLRFPGHQPKGGTLDRFLDVLLPATDVSVIYYLQWCRSPLAVDRLIAAGADPNPSGLLHTALGSLQTTEDPWYAIAESLFKAGADPEAVHVPHSSAVVSGLTLAKSEVAVDLLLKYHARADVVFSDGRGLLHLTDLPGSRFAALIEAGAPITTVDKSGQTPLIAVVSNCDAALQRWRWRSTDTERESSPYPETYPALTALLNAGADPNARDSIGQTALHLLARKVGLERDPQNLAWLNNYATALLNAGADPSLKDHEGKIATDFGPLPAPPPR